MRRLMAALILVFAAALPALAGESAAVRSPRATVTLATDAAAIAPGEPFRIGLRIRLAPGWHTYWRNAGDAGAPAEISVTLAQGGMAGEIAWPVPRRIPYGPLVNFGYVDEVLLPILVTPPADLALGGTYVIEAGAGWLACEEVCIPEEGGFRLELPVAATASRDARLAPLFDRAAEAAPRAPHWTTRAAMGGGRASLTVEGEGLSRATVREAFFFPAASDVLDHAAPQPMTLRDGALTLSLTAAERGAPPATLEGVLVVVDGGGRRVGFTIAAPVEAAPPPAALPLWQAMLFALAGGLLLNLMPCVFPILAMKAMALARLSGARRREVRTHALSYTAGVVLCFALLGGALIALRASGLAIGWGFQFTESAFVAAMAWLMLAVGLNLSGVFFVSGGGASLGSSAVTQGGHLGSFATGALAVLVATPCTAPFMAAAIGAALAMTPAETLSVFVALGVGLAAPYALLAVMPGLARVLPRPGGWMEWLRQGLAFPMYGAAVWLVWVLAQQAGPDGVLLVLAGAVLLGFGAWALGLAQRARRGVPLGATVALVALIGAAALLPRLTPAPIATAAADAWSAARMDALRAGGRAVFVNATAAWCISCKVNERIALTAAVRAAFAARGIAYLVADWTRGDPAIGALLRAHGREGVPLYVFYPAGGGAPAVLPALLTEGMVLRAIGAG